MSRIFLVLLAVPLFLLGGCSTRQLYLAGQQSQQLECNKLPDMAARQRCLAQAKLPYEDYRREVDGAASPQTAK
ncbi:hypothetical protein [Chitinimonas sp.]|uniref:hypothetical protein n=1 Tax=Chitinimonas sp. TaxID=1934313 RepID=UPI002F94C464